MAVNSAEFVKITVEYVKSCIGYPERQKRTLRALGLKRLGDQVEVQDTDAIRGMLRRVEHLVEVTVSGPDALSSHSDAPTHSDAPDARAPSMRVEDGKDG